MKARAQLRDVLLGLARARRWVALEAVAREQIERLEAARGRSWDPALARALVAVYALALEHTRPRAGAGIVPVG